MSRKFIRYLATLPDAAVQVNRCVLVMAAGLLGSLDPGDGLPGVPGAATAMGIRPMNPDPRRRTTAVSEKQRTRLTDARVDGACSCSRGSCAIRWAPLPEPQSAPGRRRGPYLPLKT